MTILGKYNALVDAGDIEDDVEQRDIIGAFESVADQLTSVSLKKRWQWRKTKMKAGLYLYGSVGTGKTFLMDLFYDEVPESKKGRFHFHHFMQQIDAQLRRLQGQANPLQYLARQMGKSLRLLCLDEFLVYDVAQAMILAELLQALFAEGIVLVTTSNTKPDDLYLNGVQRERFLPAIALIQAHCNIVQVTHLRDYRLAREQDLEMYMFPLTSEIQDRFAQQFAQLEPEADCHGTMLIQNREIPFVQCKDNVVWFKFAEICNLPRSQLDYLEIADRFRTVFISDVPCLSESSVVFVILFIQLVDVFYDRGIRLVLSAEVGLEALYPKGEMLGEFKRILSRLEEMQSLDYRRRHLPKSVCTLLPILK